jgi:uncharacterized membrane protein (UPF0136 family)
MAALGRALFVIAAALRMAPERAWVPVCNTELLSIDH